MIGKLSRRLVLGLTAAVALATRGRAAVPTPAQSAGPFYPPPNQRPADDDWDLVKVDGQQAPAAGQVLHLSGRVLDRQGQPVPGVLIEIWQCDAHGRYLHQGDRQAAARDAGFQGYGATRSGADGSYRFRTIRPVAYPGRTPHIHARLLRPDGSTLTTQLYVAGEPSNRQDFIFRSLGRAGQEAASMHLSAAGDGALTTDFDFVV